MVTFLICETLILACMVALHIIDAYAEYHTWKRVRQAANQKIEPGETIIVDAPSCLYNGKIAACVLMIAHEKDGLRRFKYRIDIGDATKIEFYHDAVNDCADGDLVDYLKHEIYRGRWIEE